MKNICLLCSAIILSSALIGCSKYENTQVSVFSWQESQMDEMDKQSRIMEKTKAKQLYQNLETTSDEQITQFLYHIGKNGYTAYALCGEPEWIFEPQYLINQMERYALYKEQGLQGIVIDVEPYLLPQWKDQKYMYMQSYVSLVKDVYRKAQSLQLELIVCIPYYYDTLQLQTELEQLFQYSDGIAVMNYYKENEYQHIAYELELAEMYQKKLVIIYEMQKPGNHALTDQSTYYKEGIKGVEASFADIRKQTDYQQLEYAYHGLYEGGFMNE